MHYTYADDIVIWNVAGISNIYLHVDLKKLLDLQPQILTVAEPNKKSEQQPSITASSLQKKTSIQDM